MILLNEGVDGDGGQAAWRLRMSQEEQARYAAKSNTGKKLARSKWATAQRALVPAEGRDIANEKNAVSL